MTDPLFKTLDFILRGVENGLSTPVERSFVVPGANHAWDGCSQLYVRILRIDPVTQRGGGRPCSGSLNLELGIGVVRCVDGMDDDGTPPSPEQLSADAAQFTLDLTEIHSVLTCGLEGLESIGKITAVRWHPSGPEGNMAQGEWVASLVWQGCGCV